METVAPPPLAVVKVGSTSVSVLVAGRLSEPLFLHARVLRLIQEPDPARALDAVMGDVAASVSRYRPRTGLVALGELGRLHPDLSRSLARQGYPVWALSGPEEGRVAWWGEQMFYAHPITVVDVGGGSTEIAGSHAALSLPVGTERPPRPEVRFPAEIGAPGGVVAIGGTARALGLLFGSPLRRETLMDYARRPPACWPDVDRVEPERRPLLSGGLCTVLWVMEGLGVERLPVSERDLRWGLWLSARLGRAGRWPGG